MLSKHKPKYRKSSNSKKRNYYFKTRHSKKLGRSRRKNHQGFEISKHQMIEDGLKNKPHCMKYYNAKHQDLVKQKQGSKKEFNCVKSELKNNFQSLHQNTNSHIEILKSRITKKGTYIKGKTKVDDVYVSAKVKKYGNVEIKTEYPSGFITTYVQHTVSGNIDIDTRIENYENTFLRTVRSELCSPISRLITPPTSVSVTNMMILQDFDMEVENSQPDVTADKSLTTEVKITKMYDNVSKVIQKLNDSVVYALEQVNKNISKALDSLNQNMKLALSVMVREEIRKVIAEHLSDKKMSACSNTSNDNLMVNLKKKEIEVQVGQSASQRSVCLEVVEADLSMFTCSATITIESHKPTVPNISKSNTNICLQAVDVHHEVQCVAVSTTTLENPKTSLSETTSTTELLTHTVSVQTEATIISENKDAQSICDYIEENNHNVIIRSDKNISTNGLSTCSEVLLKINTNLTNSKSKEEKCCLPVNEINLSQLEVVELVAIVPHKKESNPNSVYSTASSSILSQILTEELTNNDFNEENLCHSKSKCNNTNSIKSNNEYNSENTSKSRKVSDVVVNASLEPHKYISSKKRRFRKSRLVTCSDSNNSVSDITYKATESNVNSILKQNLSNQSSTKTVNNIHSNGCDCFECIYAEYCKKKERDRYNLQTKANAQTGSVTVDKIYEACSERNNMNLQEQERTNDKVNEAVKQVSNCAKNSILIENNKDQQKCSFEAMLSGLQGALTCLKTKLQQRDHTRVNKSTMIDYSRSFYTQLDPTETLTLFKNERDNCVTTKSQRTPLVGKKKNVQKKRMGTPTYLKSERKQYSKKNLRSLISKTLSNGSATLKSTTKSKFNKVPPKQTVNSKQQELICIQSCEQELHNFLSIKKNIYNSQNSSFQKKKLRKESIKDVSNIFTRLSNKSKIKNPPTKVVKTHTVLH